MKKVYTIEQNEAYLTFNLGKLVVRAHFEGGNMAAFGITARCVTDNPLVQAAIENDVRFGKAIQIDGKFKDDQYKNVAIQANKAGEEILQAEEEILQAEKEALQEEPRETIINDVTDINGIIDYLKTKKGVTASAIRSKNLIKEKIAEYHLVFPNVKI